MEVLKQLLGRLHPIIVHFPIGFIILALLLQWVSRKKNEFKKVIPLIFLWGAISAVIACLTGYLQYLGEGYAFATVKTHLWFGIITAIVAFVLYLQASESSMLKFIKKSSGVFLSLLLFGLISFTGHLGGSITHGEDYLVAPLPNRIKSALGFEVYEEKPIVLTVEDWEDTQFYDGVIAPILNNNCAGCHNKKRAKGALLLNSKEGILAGGENGEVLVSQDPENSPLYARLILPQHHEDHMPPKDKRQPSKEEIALIRTWILEDLPFNKSIGELGLQKALFKSFFPKKPVQDYPDIEISAASPDAINSIKNEGIHVQNISMAANFLSVSCINKPAFTDADFKKLIPIREQIAVLDLGGTKITDAIFEDLATIPHLTVLKIDDTAIRGNQIKKLQHLQYLSVLNMTGTKFEKKYLPDLGPFKKLQAVYLFNTGLSSQDNPDNLKDCIAKI